MRPQDPAAYAALAQLYVRAGRKLPQARELAWRAVSLAPTAQNYVVLGGVCEKAGDLAGARAALERAMALEPGNEQFRRWHESLREKP